jgi:hypothetical protein
MDMSYGLTNALEWRRSNSSGFGTAAELAQARGSGRTGRMILDPPNFDVLIGE